jgi:hypothetical protein
MLVSLQDQLYVESGSRKWEKKDLNNRISSVEERTVSREEHRSILDKLALMESHFDSRYASFEGRIKPQEMQLTIYDAISANLLNHTTNLRLEVDKVAAALQAKCDTDLEKKNRECSQAEEFLVTSINRLGLKQTIFETDLRKR